MEISQTTAKILAAATAASFPKSFDRLEVYKRLPDQAKLNIPMTIWLEFVTKPIYQLQFWLNCVCQQGKRGCQQNISIYAIVILYCITTHA